MSGAMNQALNFAVYENPFIEEENPLQALTFMGNRESITFQREMQQSRVVNKLSCLRRARISLGKKLVYVCVFQTETFAHLCYLSLLFWIVK